MAYTAVPVLFLALVTSTRPGMADSSQMATSARCEIGPCGPGNFFDQMKKSCHLCPPDTYQSDSAHKCTQCLACSTPSDVEEVIEDCTRTTDTVLMCISGYFDAASSAHRQCQKCRQCDDDESVVRPCGKRSDTRCAKTTSLDNEARKSPALHDGTTTVDDLTNNDSKNGSGPWRASNDGFVTFMIINILLSLIA